MGVNAAMFRQQETDRLASIASRLESYDVFDCPNDEVERVRAQKAIEKHV